MAATGLPAHVRRRIHHATLAVWSKVLCLLLTGLASAGPGQRPTTDLQGDPLPAGALARFGTVRLRHPQWVNGIALSPDGKTIASAGWEGAIRLWNAATGVETACLRGPRHIVMGVAFSPDGKRLVSAGSDGMIRVWDTATGRCRLTWKGHEGSMVQAVAVSPDGTLLASGGGGDQTQTLMLWDLATGTEVRRLGDTLHRVKSLAFSPDGMMLAAASPEQPPLRLVDRTGPGMVQLWDLSAGKLRWQRKEELGGFTSVAFAPDGKRVAFAGYDAVLHVRDAASGKEVHTIRVAEERYPVENSNRTKGVSCGGVLALAYSPDGKLLASAGYDATIRLWDAATGREVRVLHGHSREATGVAFGPDGKTLASCGRDQTIRLWDIARGKELQPRPGHTGIVHGLSVSRDGKQLASVGHDHVVRLWDADRGTQVHALRGSGEFIQTVALSPDGSLVAGGEMSAIQIWQAGTGRAVRRIHAPGSSRNVAFSPDGRLLASGSWQSSQGDGAALSLWGPITGKERLRIAGPVSGGFAEVAFSADGNKLGAFGPAVRIWDSASGKLLRTIKNGYHYAFLPDGERLLTLSSGSPKTVSVWDITTGRELQRFAAPDKLSSVRFALSPDGRTVAWSLTDHTIELWELASWNKRRCLAGHQGAVESMAFAPDGRILYSGSEDTTILAWDLARAGEVRLAQGRTMDLPALWRDLAREGAERADRAIRLLSADPERSVPFLEKHVRPVAVVTPQRLAHLIDELDSAEFAQRDQATRELQEMGEQAESALQKMLAHQPSLEVRRRGERLLAKLRGPLPAGERLRALRAVEVLEQAGTMPALRLLAILAAGAPEARLTQDAKASLQRLARR